MEAKYEEEMKERDAEKQVEEETLEKKFRELQTQEAELQAFVHMLERERDQRRAMEAKYEEEHVQRYQNLLAELSAEHGTRRKELSATKSELGELRAKYPEAQARLAAAVAARAREERRVQELRAEEALRA